MHVKVCKTTGIFLGFFSFEWFTYCLNIFPNTKLHFYSKDGPNLGTHTKKHLFADFERRSWVNIGIDTMSVRRNQKIDDHELCSGS